MNTLSKINSLLLLLLFFSCQKNNSDAHINDNTVLFNKTYLESLEKNKKEKYLDSVGDLLKTKENDSVTRNLYLKVATEYYYINNLEKSLSSSLKALQLSKEANDSLRISKALFYVGDCYQNSKRDSAYFYYLQAEKLYFKIHDYDNMGRMLFNKAYVLFYDGNYVECEVEISKALKYLKISKNYLLMYSCNTLMGNCLEKLVNYDEALRYHKLALLDLEKIKSNDKEKDEISNYAACTVINICNLYDLKEEYSKSIEQLKKLLTEELKRRSPILYAKALGNLAYSKMKSGDYKDVDSMFFNSLKIVDSLGDDSDVLYKKIHIGEYFLTQKDTVRSIEILKEANRLAVKIKNSNEILASLKLLSELDKTDRLFYANEYIKVSDSINLVQKNAHNKYARIEYETSRIEDENKILTKENFYILITSFGLIIILVLLIGFRYLKYRNKELQFIKKQQIANEEIYMLLTEQQKKIDTAKDNEKARMAKELHDGVMNKIYGVRMNLGVFNSSVDEETIEKRKIYITELQSIENELRTISHDLSRSSFFDGNDFNVLLIGLVENQKEFTKTQFQYINDGMFEWESVENIYKINLYRIIQEAILNINKYANASKCEVKIQRIDNNILKMSITDDGQGFDMASKKGGIGLSNMRERASSLKGQFNIESKIGEGTKIEVVFDLQTLSS
ncbi:tetratricopeptide repeat-containing sensor histidine kinase [Flavobacterium aestivum]|uniref:tetratricopeptide repeat-containing sensor histidine kinase n=1 Tax=Flavobacterium aestivum TaxID=3003257 RepID=UPI002482F202|nr:sensor histidine kinase [Flavobacterium aestivum]